MLKSVRFDDNKCPYDIEEYDMRRLGEDVWYLLNDKLEHEPRNKLN